MIQASARRGLRRHPHRMNVRVALRGPSPQPGDAALLLRQGDRVRLRSPGIVLASVQGRSAGGRDVRRLGLPGGQDPDIGKVGCPFTTWSLSKLVEHLAARRRVVISTETVSTILCDAAIAGGPPNRTEQGS